MLELPNTIRAPRADEFPSPRDAAAALKARSNAKLVEGFIFHINTQKEIPCLFYAEININNSRLWDLFDSLLQNLPEESAFMYNKSGKTASYGRGKTMAVVMQFLEPYEPELTRDPFIEFGFISNDPAGLEEILVTDCKYLKVWGNDEAAFRKVMLDYNLPETPDMNFVDEFPRAVESLEYFDESVKPTWEMLFEFDGFFDSVIVIETK